jgi:hypothetical protein
MFNITRLVHLIDPADCMAAEVVRKRITATAESTPARRVLVEPTLAGVRNGGDIVVHLQFDSAAQWNASRDVIDAALSDEVIRHVDGVNYERSENVSYRGRRSTPQPARVYRTLLFRVDDNAPAAEKSRFENATLQMPVHMPAMSAWSLSHVQQAIGTSRWTHVWEQEFTNIDALLGQYMHHPVHWALVDRWFDPECPDHIVTDRVCHTFCAMSEPVIDTRPSAPAPRPAT